MKAIMIFVGTTIIMYLFGAFIAGDFNSNNWDGVSKGFLCIVDIVISVLVIVGIQDKVFKL